MKSAVILVSEKVPEKKLLKETVYKYFPDPAVSKIIFEDLSTNIGKELPAGITTELDIKIIIKEYTDIVPPKHFWYDNKTNDTENPRI